MNSPIRPLFYGRQTPTPTARLQKHVLNTRLALLNLDCFFGGLSKSFILIFILASISESPSSTSLVPVSLSYPHIGHCICFRNELFFNPYYRLNQVFAFRAFGIKVNLVALALNQLKTILFSHARLLGLFIKIYCPHYDCTTPPFFYSHSPSNYIPNCGMHAR